MRSECGKICKKGEKWVNVEIDVSRVAMFRFLFSSTSVSILLRKSVRFSGLSAPHYRVMRPIILESRSTVQRQLYTIYERFLFFVKGLFTAR